MQFIALLGNHDRWMLDRLDADDEDYGWLHSDIGFGTVHSFVPEAVIEAIPVSASGAQIKATIKREFIKCQGDLWRAATPDDVESRSYSWQMTPPQYPSTPALHRILL